MRASPDGQAFKTEDGWFPCSLATNLAQMR